MRPRRWILALLLGPALCILGFLAAWRLLGLDERLRLQLVELLEQEGLEHVTLSAVHPAWLGLDLRGLGFTGPGGGLRLEASEARLRLSPLRWLKSPTQALTAVDWVELAEFRLLIDRALLERQDKAPAPAHSLQEWLRLLSPTLASLPEIRLRGGRMAWRDPEGREHPLVERLEGLALRHDGVLEILLRSQLLDNLHHAFRASLHLDPVGLDGRFALELDSLRQRGNPPLWLPGIVALDWRATLHVDGRLTGGRVDSLAGSGKVQLLEAELRSSSMRMNGEVDLRMSLDSLSLRAGHLALGDLELAFGGALPWRLEGGHAWIRGAGLQLAEMQRSLAPGNSRWPLLAGRLDLAATGVWRDGPRLRVSAALGGLRVDSRAMGSARAEGEWKPGQLRLDRVHWAYAPGLSAEGRGMLSLGGRVPAMQLDSRLAVELDRVDALRGILADSARVDLALRLEATGEKDGWRLRRGDLAGELSRPGARLLELHGSLAPGQRLDGHLPEGGLELTLPGGVGLGSVQVQDGVSGLWSAELDARPGGLLALLGLRSDILPTDLSGRIRLEGRNRQTEASASLSLRGRRAVLDGRLLWSDSLRSLNADLVLEGWRDCRMEGQIQARLEGRRIIVPMMQLEGLDLSGWLDLEEDRYLADLMADDLPLQLFWDLLMEDPAPFELGSLSLLAAGEGTLDNPGFRGGLEWRHRFRGRQARLRADLALDRGVARVNRGRLSLDGVEWASLDLVWNFDQGPRELLMEMLERDLAELTPPSGGGRSFLQGKLAGRLRADLRQSGGYGVEGLLHVERPRLGGHTFERFDLSLSRGGRPGTLALDSLVLTRGGFSPLRLVAKGELPLNEGELDIDIDLTGDLLRPFAITNQGKPSTFVQHAGGMGSLRLRVGGGLLDPQLREGRLDISHGRLEMASIFHHVRDIESHLEIQNGRLVIQRLEARLGDARLRVSNTWDLPVVEDLQLEPWVLERPELDCGVLILETLDRRGDPGPVEVNIPGLMEDDWSGRLTLRGALPGERFWVAGPADRPVVRGLALVDNTEFTFPFIKSEQAPTPLLAATIAFINSIEWDLAVQAGRNVNYWRKVQGFDDQTYMDLLKGYLDRITVDIYIDPMAQPILFQGQVEDESFRVLGEVGCSRGSVLFLDKDFEVEEAGMSFDASTLLPLVWGRAVHTALDAEMDPGLQSFFSQDARQVWLQFRTDDELGNRQLRGRWDEIRVELVDDLNYSQGLMGRGQEELLVEMGLNPYDPGGAIGTMLPDVVAGFWEIPLRPIESRIRRQLGLDEVRIFLPVLRNTVEELLATQTTREQVSQSYLDYLQGTRVILGKSLGARTFASWTGQLVGSSPVEGRSLVRLFQRCNLDYVVSRNLSLTGELVFDPLRQSGAIKGDPRILLRYRQRY